jgi:2-oxoisovalerate dehydrogenase E1 component
MEHTELLLKAYLIRRVEERLLELFAQGKIAGTIHTCIGQELTGLAVTKELSGEDVIFSNHRCHGHYIARFNTFRPLISEILGKPSGVCQGFGGSQHLSQEGFYSTGIQGGITPTAVGFALSKKLKGGKGIVANFIGDGTLGQGVVYEGMNFSSLHQLPILFVLENNFYSQSTHQSETLAGTIEGRARAFGLEYYHTSTYDIDDLLSKSSEAISKVRVTRKPIFLEIETYRLAPHSKGDDNRTADELNRAREKDLLNIFLKKNKEDRKIQNEVERIDKEIDSAIRELAQERETITFESSDSHQKSESAKFTEVAPNMSKDSQVKQINAALHEAFKADSQMMMIGEDLRDPYGGTFKVSRGLSELYPKRVLNMPIAEASVIGVGLGLAMSGHKTISEIMFGDFVSIAFDQILNHASKFRSMYSAQTKIPFIIRTPMGGGRGYGSTHSQSLEKYLAGITDVDLYMLHPRTDVKRFYQNLIGSVDRTSVVIENKLLYPRTLSDTIPQGYRLVESKSKFPMSRLMGSDSPDVTVVAFGGMGLELEKAIPLLSDEEIFLDVFYPLHVNGFDFEGICESVSKSGKLLFVEEGVPKLTISEFYLAQMMKILIEKPQFEILTALNRPIPASRYLEDQALPTAKKIVSHTMELFHA